MIPILRTFVIALGGVALFQLVNIPLPWLLGPICACLVAAILGVRLDGYKPLTDGMRTILGVAVGATLTPVVLSSIPGMWPTLLMVPCLIGMIGLVGIPYFQRLWGYDFTTSYYAAMPGGFQDMVLFGEETGGNVRMLSLIHATRLLVIVVTLPFLLAGVWQADLGAPPGVPLVTVPAYELALMALCAIVGWQGARRLGLFGASILGPLILTTAVTLAGFLHARPPSEAIWMAQFFIGMTIGAKYSGITLTEVRRDLLAGLGFCVLLILPTGVVVQVSLLTGLAPGMEALLAFAPGGQAELTVLALIVGADMAFVVTHHVLRIFLVILGAPLAIRFFAKGPKI